VTDNVNAAPDRVAFLIPGISYSVERPLLHFARAVFAAHGWTTRDVRWPGPPPQPDGTDFRSWNTRLSGFAQAHVASIVDRETAPRIALVGKSLGAFAAAVAADRNLPAIWLTPMLRDSDVPGDLSRSTAPFLLVGSAADPSWDSAAARSFGRPVFEAEGADHSMETVDDPVNSAELLRQATIAMDAFVRAL
jgi:hypothetical protein